MRFRGLRPIEKAETIRRRVFRRLGLGIILSLAFPALCAFAATTDYLTLFKITVAGDYQSLRVSRDGQTEYVRFNRSYHILSHKKSKTSYATANDLLGSLLKIGFFKLPKDYPAPTSRSSDGLRISSEDVYYWIESLQGKRIHAVLAHEATCPKDLASLIGVLLESVANLPESGLSGIFLMAQDFRVYPHLRREKGMNSLDLGPGTAGKFPAMGTAFNQTGLLVPIKGAEMETLTTTIFLPERHLLKAASGKDQKILFLLSQNP
jgi:hypothetical protein